MKTIRLLTQHLWGARIWGKLPRGQVLGTREEKGGGAVMI